MIHSCEQTIVVSNITHTTKATGLAQRATITQPHQWTPLKHNFRNTMKTLYNFKIDGHRLSKYNTNNACQHNSINQQYKKACGCLLALITTLICRKRCRAHSPIWSPSRNTVTKQTKSVYCKLTKNNNSLIGAHVFNILHYYASTYQQNTYKLIQINKEAHMIIWKQCKHMNS